MPEWYQGGTVVHAYHTDGTDEWYGWAKRGTPTSSTGWMICKIEYDGDNWIEKFPNGKDTPDFEWDEVESYSYYILGMTS